MSYLRILGTALVLVVSTQLTQPARAEEAPQPIVTPLMTKDLPDEPGKEMLILSVEYPPGAVEHILSLIHI